MTQEIPKQLQDKLAQFQNMQGQMQLLSLQKQQLFLQSADADNALGALEKADTGAKIYKAAGPILVETSKTDSEKKLKEDKELSDAKLKMIEKQEAKLTEKLEELRTEIQGMLKGAGGQTGAM